MKKNYIHPAVQDLRWTGITMQTASPNIGLGDDATDPNDPIDGD